MTNYNERLDEILSDLREDAISYGEGLHHGSVKSDDEIKIASESLLAIQTEAKQAITSLTKEMVDEAKPEIKAHPLGPVTLADCQRGLNHYEANLLKALEDDAQEERDDE